MVRGSVKTPDPIDDPAIPGLLSLGRHGTYLAATNDDHGRAVRLYAWNIEASAAFWGGFHLLEVCLRNTLNVQLTDLAGRDDCWQSGLLLQHEQQRRVTEATRFVSADKGSAATPGHVVAELTFAFWTALLANRYHRSLWEPALQYAFPYHQGRRGDVHASLERLRKLRNRIAHHEPIFARNLAGDHQQVLTLLAAIDPAMRTWAERDSRAPSVLAKRSAVLGGELPTSF